MSQNITALAVSFGMLVATGSADAQQVWQSPAQPDAGMLQMIAHKHTHKSGHDLLGDKIHQDGRHELEKHKGRSVSVDTRHGKVVGMAAGDFPVKRVKSGSKMASLYGGLTLAAFDTSFQLAQDDGYYGYCIDDGVEYDCYWYPASDIDDPDGDWAPYDPSY
jgi:hypothetical protein